MDDSSPIPLKCCSKCGNEYPATTELFYSRRESKDGLSPQCRECIKAQVRYRRENPLVKPIIPAGCKRCDDCKRDLPSTLEYFHAYKRSKDGLRNICKECRGIRDKAYRQNNHESYLEYERKYRETHRERIQEVHRRYTQSEKGRRHNAQKQRRYRQNHRVKYLKYVREYYWKTRQRRLGSMRQYRATHLEYVRALSRDYARRHADRLRVTSRHYRRTHLAQHRIYESNRRARKRSVLGSHTPQQIQEQYLRQHKKCYYCKNRVKWGKHHVDHTFPLSRVIGTDIPANDISYLVITCETCNLKKNNKFPWEFPEGGRLL